MTLPDFARRPAALRPGDRVAVVSPCGPVLDDDLLDAGIGVVRSWGLDVVEGAHTRAAAGHLAGSDAARAADLNTAIGDPSVRALWVARGGYGMTRILDLVDWDALAADPVLIVGFSDVTALLVAAWQRVGLISVHGQFAGRLSLQSVAVLERLRRVVLGCERGPVPDAVGAHGADIVLRGAPVCGGRATGVPLVGGNLTVLAALAGTADQLRAPGCVVLVEEVGEAPYRVDRALTQLLVSGSLDGVAGIAVGAPVRCDPPANRPSATFDAVIADRLGRLGIPLVTGLPIGHMPDQRPFLHGGRVTLDGSDGTLTMHERLADM